MYKRSSLMCGGERNLRPLNNKRNWKKSHGNIVISMIDGVKINPPLVLAGNVSSEAKCSFCLTFFGIKPETLVIILGDDYIFSPEETKTKYKIFCCEEHCDKWELNSKEKQERLKGRL